MVRGVYGRIEGRQWAAVVAPAVVLGANCLGLGPVSEPNPRQFGNLDLAGSHGRSGRRYSLPSMKQF